MTRRINMLRAKHPSKTSSEDLYADGRHYDRQHAGFDEDIPFYLKMARDAGSVLELACGTCRLGIPIAKAGIDYMGIDISEGMLRWAHRKADDAGIRLRLVRADIRSFYLRKRFPLIILAFNTICHLYTRSDLENCLACVREHLSHGGRFVIDVFNPALPILTRDPSEHYPAGEYDDPDGSGRIVVTETNVYDRASQINWITWYYHTEKADTKSEVHFGMRIYYPQELDALLGYNGFRIEAKYGAFDGSPFRSESGKQIVVVSSAR